MDDRELQMLLSWLRKIATADDGQVRLSMIDRSYAARLLRWITESQASKQEEPRAHLR